MKGTSFFRLFLGIICSSFLFSACQKGVSTPAELTKKYGVESFDFTFLSTKSHLSFQNQKQELGSNVDIRMAKDSLIWLSARPAFGIEAARLLIRTDSAFMVNRLEKSYIALDIQSLSKQVNFDGDFKTLQALFLGNVPPLDQSVTPEKQEKFFVLKQMYELFKTSMYVSRENKKLSKMAVQENDGMNSLFIDYSNFQTLDKQKIPFKVNAVANFFNQKENKTDQTKIEIEHKRINFENSDLSFPFSIPSNYAKKELNK
ncbi:hypothetical protein Fleli_3817 [Bernardetia litoralis DSM 6794]|uniref:DUF4292 domain-containing protein n=1 Tax=Bernardetia litoralis (strain ATCC 23117 / DSM 6794 / NBRC 15988 / NCIMB 1366 / Fx l1 / Sio-4) TaxID=880071 RepID=I4AQ88_BERLS|nr:DUF4292 domain-containing protein [Bernardetia litoralis]AFM06123.1 hypothetical protein Fleli_3817 [Bernardetia litoralis DSM 6794]